MNSYGLHPPERVPLSNSPLVLALAQVRYSPTPALVSETTEARLTAHLDGFPVTAHRGTHSVDIGQSGTPDVRVVPERHFESISGSSEVTVTSEFVAYSTTQYAGRESFLAGISSALTAVAESCQPAALLRIGVRYIDRTHDVDAEMLIRESMRAASQSPPEGASLLAQIVNVDLATDTDRVAVRSLHLPANSTYDPMIQPVDTPSWILDIDSFTESRKIFDVPRILEDVERLADNAYAAFRWAVTSDFINRYK